MNQKYIEAFKVALQIEETVDFQNLEYREAGWNSIAHTILISEIEDAFDIVLETEDVIDFNSFEKGKEILRKYGIEI